MKPMVWLQAIRRWRGITGVGIGRAPLRPYIKQLRQLLTQFLRIPTKHGIFSPVSLCKSWVGGWGPEIPQAGWLLLVQLSISAKGGLFAPTDEIKGFPGLEEPKVYSVKTESDGRNLGILNWFGKLERESMTEILDRNANSPKICNIHSCSIELPSK